MTDDDDYGKPELAAFAKRDQNDVHARHTLLAEFVFPKNVRDRPKSTRQFAAGPSNFRRTLTRTTGPIRFSWARGGLPIVVSRGFTDRGYRVREFRFIDRLQQRAPKPVQFLDAVWTIKRSRGP